MPILERGYEPWTGTLLRRKFAAWPIALAALRRNMRWYAWTLAGAGVAFGSGFATVMLLLAYGAASFVATNAAPPAFLQVVVSRPEFHLEALMAWQFFWAIALATLVGAGEVAEDVRTGAVVFYLGRPVSRWDYCLGKVLAVSLPIVLVTFVPTLLLFTMQALFEGTWRWFADHARVVPASLGLTLVLCLFTSGLVLGTSALVRRRRWASVAIAAVYLVLVAVAGIVATSHADTSAGERALASAANAKTPEEAQRRLDKVADQFDPLGSPSPHAGWRFLSPNASLHAVGRDLLGIRVPSNFSGGRHWILLLGIGALGFAVLWRRVRAVEIVT
jgi:hypothetical protein